MIQQRTTVEQNIIAFPNIKESALILENVWRMELGLEMNQDVKVSENYICGRELTSIFEVNTLVATVVYYSYFFDYLIGKYLNLYKLFK